MPACSEPRGQANAEAWCPSHTRWCGDGNTEVEANAGSAGSTRCEREADSNDSNPEVARARRWHRQIPPFRVCAEDRATELVRRADPHKMACAVQRHRHGRLGETHRTWNECERPVEDGEGADVRIRIGKVLTGQR